MAEDSGGGAARATAIVLFTDLVGSTALRARLGEDVADELRRGLDGLVAAAVAARHGRVVKNLGDGVMATFAGASDGVAAAVAIQQAVDLDSRSAGPGGWGVSPGSREPLAVRIGLSAGDVAFEAGDCFGTPVIEAARLCAAARGGQVLVSEVVRLLVGAAGGHEFAPVGALDLKGLPAPVAACEVRWDPLPAARLPLPSLLTGPGRIFVGRDGELERALRLWKEVSGDGGRHLLLLAGEPGIGKTRLATELARSVHQEGATVLAGRCDEDLGVPYQPFVEALRHYVAHAGAPRLGRYGSELARLVPELADRVAGLAEPLRSDPETERYRLFDAVAAWLADASGEAPVLLVLDDVHWAAKPTVLLLRHVLRSAEPSHLLVVVTYRDTDIGRGDPLTGFLADLRREGVGERVPLVGLDRAGVGAFMEAAAGHPLAEDQDSDFVRAVWEETEGNPFFVTEVVRHFIETGGLEERDGRWVTTVPVEQLGIPEGVRDVVGRRLSRLPEGTDRILAVAAVAGLEFEPAVIAAAGGCTDDELFSALERAAAARLVSEVPGGSRYRFSHALVRATLYEEISGPRRVALHRKLAEAIETIHGRHLDDHLPALAHHWARAAAPAADADRAVDYATRAGNRALTQLAHDEAARYYTQALELLAAAGTADDDARRQELLISAGEAQRRAGDPAHRETLLAAATLARERGDADALARAALANTRAMIMVNTAEADTERVAALEAALAATDPGDSAVRARLLATLALESFVHGEAVDRRSRLSDEALAMARRLGDPATLTSVLMARYYTIRTPATLTERWANTAELLELAERLGDPVALFRAAFLRTISALEVGDATTADNAVEQADALARELGQPTLLWTAGVSRAGWLARHGRLREAEDVITANRQRGLATGQADTDAYFIVQIFFVLREQGRLGELEEVLPDLLRRWPLPVLRAFLAETYWEAGRDTDARAIFDAFAAGRLAGEPLHFVWMFMMTTWASVAIHLDDAGAMADLYAALSPFADQIVVAANLVCGATTHHLGVLAAGLGDLDRALGHFVAALATHERMALPTWVVHTTVELGAVLLRRGEPGDRQRALGLLDRVLASGAELGLGGVERRARQLLAEAGR